MGKLKVGDKAPDFTLPDQDGQPFSLAQQRERGPVVLFFYPKDNSAGCTMQACSFRDAYQDFQDAGVDVIGISQDDQASHQSFVEGKQLPYRLLSDPGNLVGKLYGVETRLLVMRGRITFLVDRDGTVREVFDSVLNIPGHVPAMLKAIEALKQERAPAAS